MGAPDNLNLLNQAVRVKFGEKEITFHLNEQGIGKEPRAMLRILNTDETSVARGSRLDFQLTFSGADWLDGVAPAVSPSKGAAPVRTVPLVIEIGPAHHTTTVSILSRVQTH
jgi:hypothetical protein